MADTTALKNRIRAAIKANDNQEITGPVLQQALLDIVDELNGATETEASQRQNADSTLQQNINTEAGQRQNADSILSGMINSEAQVNSNYPHKNFASHYKLVPESFRVDRWITSGGFNPDATENYGYNIYDISNLIKFGAYISIYCASDNKYMRPYCFTDSNEVFKLGPTLPCSQKNYYIIDTTQLANLGITKLCVSFENKTINKYAGKVMYLNPDFDKLLKKIAIPGWTYLNSVAYNNGDDTSDDFQHIVQKVNKDYDIFVKGLASSNQHFNYLYFLDNNLSVIDDGKLYMTEHSSDFISKNDIPENARYFVCQFSKSQFLAGNVLIKHQPDPVYYRYLDVTSKFVVIANRYADSVGQSARDYTDNKLSVTNSRLNNIRDSHLVLGWLAYDDLSPSAKPGNRPKWIKTDHNFVFSIIRLNKDANLVVKGAESNNQWLYYIMFLDKDFKFTHGLTNNRHIQDIFEPEDYKEDDYYVVAHTCLNNRYSLYVENGVTEFLDVFEAEELISPTPEPEPYYGNLLLPPTINAVVGDTMQIFYEDIFFGDNLEDFSIKVRCAKGKVFPRYFEYTPVAADIGNTNLTISLTKKRNEMDAVGKVCITKTVTLKTIAAPTLPSLVKRVLFVGDSTIAGGGTFGKECARRLCSTGGTPAGLGLSNIKFLGRLHSSVDNVSFNYEGNSGWQWNSYISGAQKSIRFYVENVNSIDLSSKYKTSDEQVYNVTEINITGSSGNILCTYPVQASFPTPPTSGTLTKVEGSGDSSITYTSIAVENYSPFVVDGVLDFTDYINTFCEGNIDILAISLGINSIVDLNDNNDIDYEATIGAGMKTFIDKFHTQYPNAKVLIATVQNGSFLGGFGYNFGAGNSADGNFYKNKLYKLNKMYIDVLTSSTYSSFVKVVDVCSEFDARHSYPNTDKGVNIRSNITEKVDNNFGHPNGVGYNLMADSFYRAISEYI